NLFVVLLMMLHPTQELEPPANPARFKGIKPCIPGRKSRGKPIKHDKRRYKRRNRIEIMFGRLKDWRRVATRYDRCPKVFLSAVALAATVMFWL
ncbi:transposase, partial [Ruixingdingia sedimenti]